MSSPSTVDNVPSPATIRDEAGGVLDAVASVVVGRQRTVGLALAAVLAGGHVMFEDVPGLGKTLMARALAQALGLEFRRVQCTPDLQPADITGSFIYDPTERDFSFREGPVFAGILLADEINRTPPKTQAALLEAMQERQVTVEGRTFPLPQPFHVLATANPIEYEGTYPLPEAQLDRFLLRLDVGYPPPDEEAEVLRRRMARRKEEVVLDPVIDAQPPRGAAGRSGAGRRGGGRAALLRRPRQRHPRSPRRSRSVPRPAARRRCCWSRGPSRCWPGGPTCCPRTSRSARWPRSRTGSRCARRRGARA